MERAIAIVLDQVKPEDEDSLDIVYWQSKEVHERPGEVACLRKNYYT